MNGMDIHEAARERRLAELEAEVAALKRTMTWWHQFSATALPLILTIVLSVYAMITVQNGRFDELSKRVDNVETRLTVVGSRVQELAVVQTETRTLLGETRTVVGRLEDKVEKLATGQRTLEDEMKKLHALLEARLPQPTR